MAQDLRETYSLDNLNRAWGWLNTGTNRFYKDYFRHLYRAYGIAQSANLVDLNRKLRNGVYLPTQASKVYIPKRSGLQRTITLLCIEDQIVYQSFANVLADRLLPKMQRRYMREAFGNVYAGKRSKSFYRDWRTTYDKYSRAIRKTFKDGFVYTASFDLTSFYDTIDHSVLGQLLRDLDLQPEFINRLCELLKHWTATSPQQPIYQGHGIPQGPLASGLVAEAVLRYFDERRPVKGQLWRYFRYVDDIRFFARNEHDLRLMLVRMDLLSKQIGLFPQSSKIEIHKVRDIEAEIKSVSDQAERDDNHARWDQTAIHERLCQLSRRSKVSDETKFKYWLGAAIPSAKLSSHLIRVVDRNPHLYEPVFRCLEHYRQVPQTISSALLKLLRKHSLYPAIPADGLRLLCERCHPRVRSELIQLSDYTLAHGAEHHAELYAAAQAVQMIHNRLPYAAILGLVTETADWWVRADLARRIPEQHIGRPSYTDAMNVILTDTSDDVGIIAAYLIAYHGLTVSQPINKIGPLAQLSLRESGEIGARRGGPCPISKAMAAIFGPSVSRINWRRILGPYYLRSISKAAMLRAYHNTDATAWVNLADTIHDDLVDLVFTHEGGALGTYERGKIGSVLGSPTGRFAKKYPRAFRAFFLVHKKRLASALSHSTTRSSGRNTRYISFSEMGRLSSAVRAAYLELWDKW